MSRIARNDAEIAVACARFKDEAQWKESCRLIEAGKAPSEMFQALAVRPDLLEGLSAFAKALSGVGRRSERSTSEWSCQCALPQRLRRISRGRRVSAAPCSTPAG